MQHLTKIFSRLKYLTFCLALLASLLSFGFATVRAAEALPDCDPSAPLTDASGNPIQCNPKPVTKVSGDPQAQPGASDGSLIENYLNPIISFLAALVGLIAVISIVVGGIQYASSADEPQKLSAAKTRIVNAILALVAFLFLYVFLQWVLPGGFL